MTEQSSETADLADEAGLLRRIHPDQVVPNSDGSYRPSSAAFKDPEMSVDAEPVLQSSGLDWHFSLEGYERYSLVRFEAGAARERGLEVVAKPSPENIAHTEVLGKKTSSISNHLKDSSKWVHLELPTEGEPE